MIDKWEVSIEVSIRIDLLPREGELSSQAEHRAWLCFLEMIRPHQDYALNVVADGKITSVDLRELNAERITYTPRT